MITERALIRKLLQQGCERDEAGEATTPASLRFTHDGRTFFVPKAPNGLSYPEGLVEEIEQTLEFLGLELLPLDYN